MNNVSIICIIDDDEVYQFTATHSLKSLGVAKKILVFSDGEDAYQFLHDNIGNSNELPDIIFLDIRMPYMDGWAFLEEYTRIKSKLPKKITIYMVSSSVDTSDVERAKSISDVSDYIIKPITSDQFQTLVERQISS